MRRLVPEAIGLAVICYVQCAMPAVRADDNAKSPTAHGPGTGVSVYRPPATANAVYEEGLRDFLQRHYQQAVVKLARASGMDPTDATIHYYLGRALIQVQEKDQAAQELRVAYALDSQGSIGDFCKRALLSYRLPVPGPQDVEKLRATIYGAAYPPTNRSSVDNRSVAVAVPKAPKVERALTVIRRQVDYEKKKDKSIAELTSDEIMTRAKQDIDAMRSRCEADVARLYAPQVNVTDPRMLMPEYLQQREQEIRAAEKSQEERLMRRAQEKSDQYRTVGSLRQSALDQVAENLEKQMSEGGKSSGVRLIPEGTDLYVRRYASTTSSRAVPDAHPAVVRIYGKPPEQENVEPDAADEKSHDYAKVSERRTVRGKLLKN